MELLYDGMGADLDNLAMRRSSVRGRLRDSGAGREKVGETRQQFSLSALPRQTAAAECRKAELLRLADFLHQPLVDKPLQIV